MNTVNPVIVRTQYTYRPVRLEDMPGVHGLLAAIAARQPYNYAPDLADIQSDFADPWCNLETDTRVALAPGGLLVAYCRVLANPKPEDTLHVYLDDDIRPEHRNQG